MELDPLPATQRTAHFPLNHTSRQVSHPRKGRAPREELGTRGLHGEGAAKVPRHVERNSEGGNHAQERVLSWGVMPVLTLAAKRLTLAETPPPCPEATNLDREASTL